MSSSQFASDLQIEIHLRALSDGGHHPAARRPSICYSRAGDKPLKLCSVSVTTSRLVMLASVEETTFLVIWDWRTTQVLLVREPTLVILNRTQRLVQEVDEDHCDTAEFIDDYQLLVGLGSTRSGGPPCLVLIDTEEGVGGTHRQTRFHLAARFANFGRLSFVLEEGAHKPSAAESLAPFHQDPSQRIVALNVGYAPYPLVLQVGALLELKNRGEADIEWDEWKSHVAFPHFRSDHEDTSETWVSGCRLFSLCSVEYLAKTQLDMHDFNMRGDSDCLYEEDEELYGELQTLDDTEGREEVPGDEIIGSRCVNGSIIFFTVSDNIPFFLGQILMLPFSRAVMNGVILRIHVPYTFGPSGSSTDFMIAVIPSHSLNEECIFFFTKA